MNLSISLRHLVDPPIRHVAEAVSSTLIGSGYFWLPWIEEGLRIGVGAVGLVVACLQGYLAWQSIKRQRAGGK